MKYLLTVLLLTASLAFAKDRAWQTGTIVSFDKKTFADADDNRVYVLVVKLDGLQYVAERELPFAAQRAPMFTEGSSVKLSIDGKDLIAIEDGGREFKMRLIKKRISP